MITDNYDNYWTVIGFEQDDDVFVLVVRLTTFTIDGAPGLDKNYPDDIQFRLGEHIVNFDCKKLGGPVPDVHLPDYEHMM